MLANVEENITKQLASNISNATCFVCLLHLANEKSNFMLCNNLDLTLDSEGLENFQITLDKDLIEQV